MWVIYSIWAGMAAAVLLVGVFTFLRRLVRIPPGCLLVVYGKVSGGRAVVVFDRGRKFVWPLFQDYAFLSTEPFDVCLPDRRVIRVAVGRDPALRDTAAERLLGLNPHEILRQTIDIVYGCLERGGDIDAELAKIGLVCV